MHLFDRANVIRSWDAFEVTQEICWTPPGELPKAKNSLLTSAPMSPWIPSTSSQSAPPDPHPLNPSVPMPTVFIQLLLSDSTLIWWQQTG
mmetsp:Transcript_11197/g.23827  ORF Transcript_11197/g.23827 Transcript_11197/m.23827 type:complete len:90 (+) Transcript_11197:972-1241(+)